MLPVIGRDVPADSAPVLSAWNPGNWSLRWDHYRYTRYGSGDSRGEELYDYAADPQETHNRINDGGFAAVRERLSTALDEMLVSAPPAALVSASPKNRRAHEG